MVEEFRPEDWPQFVRFPAFTLDWERLGLDDTALRVLELEILKGPDRAPSFGRREVSGRSGSPSRDRDAVGEEPTGSATPTFPNSGPLLSWRSSARPKRVT